MTDDVIYRKRLGASGRNQQVWVAWEFATEKERAHALDVLTMQNPTSDRAVGAAWHRGTDHETAGEAAESIRGKRGTELENQVCRAIQRSKKQGQTWDDLEHSTNIIKASISPRLKQLRLQKRIVAALV